MVPSDASAALTPPAPFSAIAVIDGVAGAALSRTLTSPPEAARPVPETFRRSTRTLVASGAAPPWIQTKVRASPPIVAWKATETQAPPTSVLSRYCATAARSPDVVSVVASKVMKPPTMVWV